jgi:predicted transcriptional regulator
MTRLSETEEGIEWIKQFRIDDQLLASRLLDAITLVSNDEFVAGLRQRIIDKANEVDGMVALYAEREVKRGKKRIPHRLYKQPYTKKNRRAFGMGPQPVKPTKNHDLTVGSEGIISWLISEICTEFPKKFICHPSPGQVRDKKVRKFVLVTDIIGSGNRAYEYLESAWRVASIKSWRSLKYWLFGVIAYSGTDIGVRAVKHHNSKPTIDLVKPCPTIYSEFDKETTKKIQLLCVKYDPIDHNTTEALGYKGTGALIAFSHGCPNNAPRILHALKKNEFKPIFQKRKTSAIRHIFGENDNDNELKKRLDRLHETRLAKGYWIPKLSKEGGKMLVILAALRRGPRFSEAIARKTGLTIPEIEILIEKAKEWTWVSENRYLTKTGEGQLSHARNITNPEEKINTYNESLYFPKSLRAPLIASS